jgi:hypothetical protein
MGLTHGTQGGVSFYFRTGLERQSDLSQQLRQVVVVVVVGAAAVVVMASYIKRQLPSNVSHSIHRKYAHKCLHLPGHTLLDCASRPIWS